MVTPVQLDPTSAALPSASPLSAAPGEGCTRQPAPHRYDKVNPENLAKIVYGSVWRVNEGGTGGRP